MADLDCLILGFYDYPFAEYVSMLQAMGTDSGAFQDVALAFVEHEGQPMRALDILTHFHYEDRPAPRVPFHNADFLWPVVAYLTTYLRGRGLDVEYVNLPHFEQDKLRDVLTSGVRVVAITTTLYVSPHPILALVEQVRELAPDVTIVVGGPYITNQAHALARADLCTLLEYLGADVYVMCQEGEATLAALLHARRQNGSLAAVPNLAFKDEHGDFTFTQATPESNALTENIIDYRALGGGLGEFLSVRTAKSCPFACAFCGFPERAGEYKYLDVASVERLLNAVADAGVVTTLTFLDDTFNVPKGRFKELLRMMARNRYGFKWNCFYRADQGDAEAIALMAQAGCEGVFLGVESGSDTMLARMNKAARQKHYAAAIPQLHDAGISTYASLIVGFPGETAATVQETREFVERSAPHYFRAQLWYADPVTPIWRRREEFGVTGLGFNWSHSTMTARQACDAIDRLFLDVEGSTWLPQFGFEQWSTFYLARKGMSREQIRSFLTAFNAVIKHRLTSGGAEALAPLWDDLRTASQFDRPRARASVDAVMGAAR